MKTEKVKSRNSIGWIAIVGTLILLYASYFLLYIPKQELQVQERGFRILEEYAKNIHIKRDYYQNHLKNYGGLYAMRADTNSFFGNKNGTNVQDKGVFLKAIKDLNKLIKLDSNAVFDNTKSIAEYRYKNSGEIVFNLEHKSLKADKLLQFNGKKISPLDTVKKNTAIVPFEIVMKNLKFDGLFENIALIDSEKVIYNSNGDVLSSITNFKAIGDTIAKTQGGIMLKLKIKGVDNQVLVLPFRLLGDNFYLAGFISNKHFIKKTRIIDSQLLTIISGVLLMMLIGMPILKIVFLGRKERLNVRDVYWSTNSMVLGISILILLFIGTMKYYVVDPEIAEGRVNDISKLLTERVDSDFGQLYALCDSVAEIKKHKNKGFWKDINGLIEDSSNKYFNIQDSTFEKKDSLFPFNEIIFMNEYGKAVKAVTKTAFTNLVELDLSSRDYFKRLNEEGHGWSLKSNNFEAYFIESVKSYNTGNKETAVSFRLKDKIIINSDSIPYLAITSHLPSLYDQVLPPDVAFMIINEEGKVLFHSDESKNLQENFLTEIKYHSKIISAVKYRTSETVRTTYNEKKSLAKIVPLQGKPLYHVTLLDFQHSGTYNTRVYLFTFYFILFTYLCVFLGMQIMKWSGPRESFLKSKNWSFDWLVYQTDKKNDYTFLFHIQAALILFQILSMFVIKAPVSMLFYHIIFIAYTSYAAYAVLNKNQSQFTKNLILGITVLLILLFSLLGNNSWIYGVLLLIALSLFTILIQKRPVITILSDKLHFAYLTYMLLWLCSIAVVPTISYYSSIKLQEKVLAKRGEMMYMAENNLALEGHSHDGKLNIWRRLANGNGIDSLKIYSTDQSKIGMHNRKNDRPSQQEATKYPNAEVMYRLLPGQISSDGYLMSLQDSMNIHRDWFFDNGTLTYSKTGVEGFVNIRSKELGRMINSSGVFYSRDNGMGIFSWILYFILPVILLGILIWSTFKYQATYLLNTILDGWERPRTPAFNDLVSDIEIQKIMLISFDGSQMFDQLKRKKRGIEPKHISADDFLYKKQNIASLLFNRQQFIWIYGFENYLLDYNGGDLLLSRIRELKTARCTVIFEMPYDIDFIKEYFEEYITDFKVEKDEEIKILAYMRGLNQELKDFYRYTNSIEHENIIQDLKVARRKIDTSQNNEDERLLAIAHLMKMRYRYIWNNLSRIEKLILFDIADDGMLNFKNKFLVNRLKMKGLLRIEPRPEVFDKSFQYFLKYAIKEEETTQLEYNLSKQGKWRNTKYMLLLLLVPLVAFMFISQGFSIEKIVGILSGVLALFAGAMRVTNTSLFNKFK